ncbi:hypothetical protein I3843_04G166700 [Carya illinoinensis]|nr:hypothetical protein I3843_04G166700 [Carya illinoinensis]
MAKLKIGGTWAGVIEVVLEEWTEPMLRIEVAKRSNCGPSPVGAASRRESPWRRVCWPRRNALGDSADSRQLSRHWPKGMQMVHYQLKTSTEVEDQSGQIVRLGSETDLRYGKQAVMMGLMLHANGKQLIRSENYKDALEVLTMGEEAFSLCNPKVIELIDNVPILQIDMVWCYFTLRDIRWLSVAGARLEKVREGIERAHGKDYSCVRLLQAGCHPELAIHLRLELLEGVVAYHNGEFDRSRKALTSAHAKYFQLQVPDEALSLVMSMGFKECDAKRALRMSNQDVGSAVDFLVEEKAKRAQKRERRILGEELK